MAQYARRAIDALPGNDAEYSAIVEDFVERPAINGAFANFPNEVARDKRVTPALLVLLTYRSTIASDVQSFGLNEIALVRSPVVKPGSGLGKNSIRQAVSLAQKLGYLVRRQAKIPLPDGSIEFDRAVDKLTLPDCGASGYAGRHVKRMWFDGTLSRDAMASFLYLRAGARAEAGRWTFARVLADRFGWSRPKTAKVLAELTGLGLVVRYVWRTKGRVDAVAYARKSPRIGEFGPL